MRRSVCSAPTAVSAPSDDYDRSVLLPHRRRNIVCPELIQKWSANREGSSADRYPDVTVFVGGSALKQMLDVRCVGRCSEKNQFRHRLKAVGGQRCGGAKTVTHHKTWPGISFEHRHRSMGDVAHLGAYCRVDEVAFAPTDPSEVEGQREPTCLGPSTGKTRQRVRSLPEVKQ